MFGDTSDLVSITIANVLPNEMGLLVRGVDNKKVLF